MICNAFPKKPFWPPKLVGVVLALALCFEIMVKGNVGTAAGQTGVPTKKDEVDLKIRAARQLALERRDLDSMVDRELRERFADYTYIDTDVRQVNGETMRQDLRAAKYKTLLAKQRLSTIFWTNFRGKWARVNSPESLLTVKTASEPVDGDLMAGLDKARSSNTRLRTPALLLGWLGSSKKQPNQKTLVGLLKHSLSAHPSCGKHLQQVIAIMKYVKKWEAPTHFGDECKVMHGHWDAAMLAQASLMSRAGMTAKVFVESNVELCGLVLGNADAKKVQSATDMKTCTQELLRLCASSQLGERVYGALLSAMADREFNSGVDAIIKEALLDQEITAAKVAQAHEDCSALARKWQIDSRITARRETEVWYRSLQLLVVVGCASDIATAKILSVVKSVGVRQKSLQALWFELDIMPLTPDDKPPGIDSCLLAEPETMRTLINQEAQITAPGTGDLAVQMISNKMQQLLAIDSSATLELALARALASGPGADRLARMMLQTLPADNKDKDLAESIAELEQLMKGGLFAFASRPAQGMIGEVLVVLKSLARGYPPSFTSWGGDSNLKLVLDSHLPFFIKYEAVDALKPLLSKTFYGANALKPLLSDVKKMIGNGDEINLELMKPLTVFDWLLSQQEKIEIQEILEKIWKAQGLQGSTGFVASQTGASSSSAPAQKKQKHREDNVANLFI